MKSHLFQLLNLVVVAAFVLAACNRPSAPTSTVTPELVITQTMAAVATDVQRTLQALAPSDTPTPTSTPTATQTSLPPSTPTPTAPTIASAPIAQVLENTNCRTGPATAFDLRYTALAGEKLEIVSQTTLNDYVIVRNPKNSAGTCWLWTRYVDLKGDLSGLPVATPPPTPTPTFTPTPSAVFSLSFYMLDGCVGWDPAFLVLNKGSVTFKSARVVATDLDTSTTVDVTSNVFDKRSGCLVDTAIPELAPGKEGYVYAASFIADPSGHAMTATVTLCAGTNLTGKCASRKINFTP